MSARRQGEFRVKRQKKRNGITTEDTEDTEVKENPINPLNIELGTFELFDL